MRADEKEKLLKEIEKKDDPEATRSMYFRVGKTAHKAITELAAVSGVNKSEVVRKLVTRGLTGNDIEIAKESHTVKLDWLVREGKRNKVDVDALTKSMKDAGERLDDLGIDTGNIKTLLFEIYGLLMLNAMLSKSFLIRMVRLAPINEAESKHPEIFADKQAFDLLRNAVYDLDELARFHDLSFETNTFIRSKIEDAAKRILDQVKEIKDWTGEVKE